MKILSDYNRGNETLDRDSTVEPAFAGTTTNISGQVNKGIFDNINSFPFFHAIPDMNTVAPQNNRK